MSGYFLTLEGIDGSGKSTQAGLLAEWLGQAGATVCRTQEPGGTALGAAIRALLLGPDSRMGAMAELGLYLADRAQHLQEVIRPALKRGEVVVCERYNDSTLAYQAFGRMLPRGRVSRGCRLFAPEVPDATVLLDLAPEAALARLHRQPDRLEAEGREFLARVAAGYRYLAGREPGRFLIIFAGGEVQATFREIVAGLGPRLQQAGALPGGAA